MTCAASYDVGSSDHLKDYELLKEKSYKFDAIVNVKDEELNSLRPRLKELERMLETLSGECI